MSRRTVLWWIFCLWFLADARFHFYALSQNLHDEDVLGFLSRILTANTSRFEDLTFRYEVYQKFHNLEADDEGIGAVNRSIKRKIDITYMMAGDRYAIIGSMPDMREGEVDLEHQLILESRYDGQRYYAYVDARPSYRVGSDRKKGLVQVDPYAFSLWGLDVISGGEVVVWNGDDNGYNLRLELDNNGEILEYSYTLDPEISFMPTASHLSTGGRLLWTIDEIEYAETGEGLLYPRHAVCKRYDKMGKLIRIDEMRVGEVVTDRGLNMEDFRVELPSGARVLDDDLDLVIDPMDARVLLDRGTLSEISSVLKSEQDKNDISSDDKRSGDGEHVYAGGIIGDHKYRTLALCLVPVFICIVSVYLYHRAKHEKGQRRG